MSRQMFADALEDLGVTRENIIKLVELTPQQMYNKIYCLFSLLKEITGEDLNQFVEGSLQNGQQYI